MINAILHIDKLDPLLISEIEGSFNNLHETSHVDGKFRLRKYSRVKYKEDPDLGIYIMANIPFTQSEEYNKYQGGMSRSFDDIDDAVISSNCMTQLASRFHKICSLNRSQEMEIHQMRVICGRGSAQLSPEGCHQDGYDCVGFVGIGRNNIIGGDILISTSKIDSPFFQAPLDTGTMVIVDDKHLWHNGRPIQAIYDGAPAWMDLLIFTAKK